MYRELIALRNELLFETAPAYFAERCDAAKIRLEKRLISAQPCKNDIARLLKDIAVDLRSYLPRWNLRGVSSFCLVSKSNAFLNVLEAHGYADLAAAARKEIAGFCDSRWIDFSEEAASGRIANYWGNDNALGIMEAMRLGASFVTTNPPIIKGAIQESPAEFEAIRSEILKRHPDASPEEKVTRLTLQAVLHNCRALRSIYRITNGEQGYVNFQVSPRNYDQADKMVQEIEFAYHELENALGGKPNVVFKVPGTAASIEAVKRVTAEGIGVNITVNFSVSQCQYFADAIEGGIADRSFVTIMAGRLDTPVAEELRGAGVEHASEISRNASKLVMKRVYEQLLLKKPYQRVAMLVASLRGPWNVDAAIAYDPRQKIVVSAFPDKAADYNALGRGGIHSAMREDVDMEIVHQLGKSAIFHAAYDFDAMRPEQFAQYAPAAATLQGFISVYDELLEYMR